MRSVAGTEEFSDLDLSPESAYSPPDFTPMDREDPFKLSDDDKSSSDDDDDDYPHAHRMSPKHDYEKIRELNDNSPLPMPKEDDALGQRSDSFKRKKTKQ